MSDPPNVEDFLAHFGVLGMKWGRHKSGGSSVPSSDDSVQAKEAIAKVKAGGVKSLSNEELQSVIRRMQLEQQYDKLPTSRSKIAKQFVASMLVNYGKQELTRFTTQTLPKKLAKSLSTLRSL